jgi:hypothetical protein
LGPGLRKVIVPSPSPLVRACVIPREKSACSSSCRARLTRSALTCSSGYRAINVASRSGRGCTSRKASSKVVAAGLCSSSDMLVVVSLSYCFVSSSSCPCSMVVVWLLYGCCCWRLLLLSFVVSCEGVRFKNQMIE